MREITDVRFSCGTRLEQWLLRRPGEKGLRDLVEHAVMAMQEAGFSEADIHAGVATVVDELNRAMANVEEMLDRAGTVH